MFGRPTSLRGRTALYILAPVCILLITVEVIGFRSIRNILLHQMQNTGISHLQRTANHIETRLHLPRTLLAKITEQSSSEVRSFLAETIRTIEGVVELTLTHHPSPSTDFMPTSDNSTRTYYEPIFNNNTITLHSETTQQNVKTSYSAQLTISFYDLIGRIPQAHLRGGLNTFMLDGNGNILGPDENAHSTTSNPYISNANKRKLQDLIAAGATGTMPADDSTTPEIIYGYHTLKEAPWTMVVIADGASILKPLNTFRLAYIASSLLITAIILFLLNHMASRIIRKTKQLTIMAGHLANGQFDAPLELDRDDEIGQLVASFNAMSYQLQRGAQLQKSMTLAGEIQQRLLPQSEYKNDTFEVFGVSLPCDETGGDFFDILPCPSGTLFLVVGDVVGHGVGAALLMATTRALIRSEIDHAANLATCVGRVNSLLCRDTANSGNFSTLFLLSLDKSGRTLHWVRAGHEPAMLYNVKQDSFTELKEKGVALGIDPTISFQENTLELLPGDHLILIGSDGLTDVENKHGERFGRLRLQQLIRRSANSSAEDILCDISSEIKTYADNKRPDDDITAVIAKIR
ncbi:MAG: sigma-B regulation protein RsbU (phosphoserine phosphatase) [Desulforhopalus sp.]|jgi:sigma-B regulation protein RsbU (phosphoserine phosphatase)